MYTTYAAAGFGPEWMFGPAPAWTAESATGMQRGLVLGAALGTGRPPLALGVAWMNRCRCRLFDAYMEMQIERGLKE
jgi:hypothetical protein